MTTARVVDLDLTGRTALVTGAGSGIGRACALRLAAAGADVVAVDIDGDAADRVAAETGGRAVTADLADLDGIQALPAAVDVLVNNAGLQVVAPLTEFPDDKFSLIQRVMAEAPIEPEAVAELLAYLCTPPATMITDSSVTIDGGWTAH